MQSPVVYITTIIPTMVMFLQSSNDSTKTVDLPYLMVYKGNDICSFMFCAFEMIEYFYSLEKP